MNVKDVPMSTKTRGRLSVDDALINFFISTHRAMKIKITTVIPNMKIPPPFCTVPIAPSGVYETTRWNTSGVKVKIETSATTGTKIYL